jgi:hypothetical protein
MTTIEIHNLLPLSSHLARYSFNFRDEIEFHGLLEQAMRDGGWIVDHEVKLGEKDRIDFVVRRVVEGKASEVEVGVEVKVKCSLAQVERQLKRYLAHPRLASVLVVSCSVQLARLPKTILDKPVHVMIMSATL